MTPVPPRTRSCLLCFAVKEEAAPVRQLLNTRPNVTILVTGMGRVNARKSFQTAVTQSTPDLVLTCGFAGGLNPNLKIGDVLFDADEVPGLREQLVTAGAHPGTFHCADRVAVTAQEKKELRERFQADAVEMESSVIRQLCRERAIVSATVRVISDTAGEDLPVDFNALMTADYRLSFSRLAGALLRRPGRIAGLMQLQRNTALAARRLGEVLQSLLGRLDGSGS